MTIDWHGRSMIRRTEVARRMRHADSSVGQSGSLGLPAIGCDLPRRLAADATDVAVNRIFNSHNNLHCLPALNGATGSLGNFPDHLT